MPATCWRERAGGPRSTFQVTNVNAHSLGVEGIDTDTLRKTNVVLIPRNTPLPAQKTERFATKSEGQRSIVVKVLEGESSQPGDCIAIGRTVVRDLPAGLPKGWPVEVTFEYGANGRLTVEALVPGTQHQARLELVRETGLSNEGLTRWKQPVGEAGGFKTFESAARDVLHGAPPSREASPSGIGSGIGWAPRKGRRHQHEDRRFAAATCGFACRRTALALGSAAAGRVDSPCRSAIGRRGRERETASEQAACRRFPPYRHTGAECCHTQAGHGPGSGAALDQAYQAGKEAPHSQVAGAIDRSYRSRC